LSNGIGMAAGPPRGRGVKGVRLSVVRERANPVVRERANPFVRERGNGYVARRFP